MPVSIACPKCQKKYSLPDTMLGKAVKCQQCGAAFRLPAGKQPAAAAGSANSGNRPTAASSAKLSKYGIDGELSKQPDIFGDAGTAAPAGLGNYAAEDPGFGGSALQPQRSSAGAEDDANPYSAVLNNPAVRTKKTRGGAKGQARNKRSQAENDRLRKIALGQKRVVIAALLYLFALGCSVSLQILIGVLEFENPFVLLPVAVASALAGLVALVLGAFGVFLLAKYFHGVGVAILYLVGLLLPLIGLIILLVVSTKATKELRKSGIEVGFLGASIKQFR